jgi:dinuclear metal center YbgI/SA1388 family protein
MSGSSSVSGSRQNTTDDVGQWAALVHDLYPPEHAAEWDRVGLQIGDPAWEVERVLVTLDVTYGVVEEAADGPSTIVLAHHPPLFRPLGALTPSTAAGRIALAAARAGVAVLAVHTNLDVAADGAGTSDPVLGVLGIEDAVPLDPDIRESTDVKLVTFVPPTHVDAVLDALSDAGAGVIGDYERCSFRVRGTGTFRPGPGTDPYAGEVGEDAEEEEDRLEIVVPDHRLGSAVRALVASHPYEEVAYDVYPLRRGGSFGVGRLGDLPTPRPLREVAETIRDRLPAPHLRVAGEPGKDVSRVAVVGGSGASLTGMARRAGADVLVSGDVGHHDALDAVAVGLAVIDAGHHATEAAALPAWVDRLRTDASERGLSAQVVASQTTTVPWT